MRRNRAPGAGNARELKVMALLAEEGWLCASRRHIGGAGDILAICGVMGFKASVCSSMLIEVKSTTRSAWVAFGPDDRQALVETAEKYGADPWLYWWPPRGKLARIHASEFPEDKRKPQLEVESPGS